MAEVSMRVVVATDDASEARQATDWLRALPLGGDVAVWVVAVATLTDPPSSSESLSALRHTLRTGAGAAAQRAATLFAERWPQVTTVVAEGDAAVEILHVADEIRADLIVTGARGLESPGRWRRGSTSLGVARYARCSVAVVQAAPRPVASVVIGLDHSAASRSAIAFLSRCDVRAGIRVILVHALSDGSAGASERSTAERMLEDASARLSARAGSIERLVVNGDAAREIVRVAREHDVDAVVVGARGLRTLGRLFLGSVSEAVLHHAGRTVVVAREGDEAPWR